MWHLKLANKFKNKLVLNLLFQNLANALVNQWINQCAKTGFTVSFIFTIFGG